MSVIIPVTRSVLSSVIQSVIGGGGKFVYDFDGTTMYATIPEWTALNIDCGFPIATKPTTAVTGAIQWLVWGTTAAGAHGLRISATGFYELVYRDTAGVEQTIVGSAAADGVTANLRPVYSATGTELFINGASVGTNVADPEIPKLSILSANSTPLLFFGGAPTNFTPFSTSPMQNVTVMPGNTAASRAAIIPDFTMASGSTIEIWMQAPVAALSQYIMDSSGVGTRPALLLNGSNIVNFDAAVLDVTLDAVGISTGAVALTAGQQYKIVCTTKVITTLGRFLARMNDVEFGEILFTNCIAQDAGTGITRTYNNVGDTGTELRDSGGTNQHGTWVNAGARTLLALNNRNYPMDDGPGNTEFKNVWDGSRATDAPITAFNNLNWIEQ